MNTLANRPTLIAATFTLGFFLIPNKLFAVQAIPISPQDEERASFCLHLLSRGGSTISYQDGRRIQLLGEPLVSTRETSGPSRSGWIAAQAFLSESPSDDLISIQLLECRADLESAMEYYTSHSCGFGHVSGSPWDMLAGARGRN
jgi:hypothetical protein